MKPAYYNEFDPFAATWLRNLIAAGHLPAGDVDDRSILDVRGDDLRGYGPCHFFAGIGGWPYALRLAGIPDDRPIWTGSCPCQPFSVAGSGKGTADERHLWSAFRRLIEECGPAIVFGEQVASAAGRIWLTGVRADLEELGYAVGAADLCAASVGAPHIRQRLYWVADATHANGRAREHSPQTGIGKDGQWRRGFGECGIANGLAHTLSKRGCSGDAERPDAADVVSPGANYWADSRLIRCGDGKVRRVPIEPALFPLATGLPGRVGLLRGAGNAIVPPLAAEFVMAALS